MSPKSCVKPLNVESGGKRLQISERQGDMLAERVNRVIKRIPDKKSRRVAFSGFLETINWIYEQDYELE